MAQRKLKDGFGNKSYGFAGRPAGYEKSEAPDGRVDIAQKRPTAAELAGLKKRQKKRNKIYAEVDAKARAEAAARAPKGYAKRN